MTNKKQTAIDYIFSQLPDEYTTTRHGFEVYKQAKEIDREQRLQEMLMMQIIKDVNVDGYVTFIFKPLEYLKQHYDL
jgi:hypothetical protein